MGRGRSSHPFLRLLQFNRPELKPTSDYDKLMFVLAAADMVIKRVQVVSETSDLIVLGDVHLFDQI